MRYVTIFLLATALDASAQSTIEIDGRWLFSRELSVQENESALAHPMWAGRDPWEWEQGVWWGIEIQDGIIEFVGERIVDEARPFSLRPTSDGNAELISQGKDPFVALISFAGGALCLRWKEVFVEEEGWFDPEAQLDECFVRDDA